MPWRSLFNFWSNSMWISFPFHHLCWVLSKNALNIFNLSSFSWILHIFPWFLIIFIDFASFFMIVHKFSWILLQFPSVSHHSLDSLMNSHHLHGFCFIFLDSSSIFMSFASFIIGYTYMNHDLAIFLPNSPHFRGHF